MNTITLVSIVAIFYGLCVIGLHKIRDNTWRDALVNAAVISALFAFMINAVFPKPSPPTPTPSPPPPITLTPIITLTDPPAITPTDPPTITPTKEPEIIWESCKDINGGITELESLGFYPKSNGKLELGFEYTSAGNSITRCVFIELSDKSELSFMFEINELFIKHLATTFFFGLDGKEPDLDNGAFILFRKIEENPDKIYPLRSESIISDITTKDFNLDNPTNQKILVSLIDQDLNFMFFNLDSDPANDEPIKVVSFKVKPNEREVFVVGYRIATGGDIEVVISNFDRK